MDKIITSLVNTFNRLSSCCKKEPPKVRWDSSVKDNAGKTTKAYRENPKYKNTEYIHTTQESLEEASKRMEELIRMQNQISKYNNSPKTSNTDSP